MRFLSVVAVVGAAIGATFDFGLSPNVDAAKWSAATWTNVAASPDSDRNAGLKARAQADRSESAQTADIASPISLACCSP